MKHHTRKLYIVASVIIFALIIAAITAMISMRTSKLLDKKEYKQFVQELTDASDADAFKSQDDLREYITSWAKAEELDYTVDKYGNIIFDHEASPFKSKVAPTLVCGSYNYETLDSNVRLLSSLAMIAKSDLMSGRYTVIFVNDENNTGNGYRNLNKKYFKKSTKVIYLDYGKSSYISTSSFGESISTITVPVETTDGKCDTAVRVKISGIRSDEVGSSKQANTVSALSTLLTRLKSKSTICQLADFSIEDHGNMNPVTLEATILLNSYSLSSFTKYIDKQITSWEKKYKDDDEEGDGEGFSYTYEIIDDPELMPTVAYSDDTFEKLTSILYMIKNGVYKYESSDIIPDGRAEGDTCGINAITGLSVNDRGEIEIRILSQGYDNAYLDRIHSDNSLVASLFDCDYQPLSMVEPFQNTSDSLVRLLHTTYSKVNDESGTDVILRTELDNYFTPCSYLSKKREGMDIIHLRLNKDKVVSLTNTILCYIVTKGNFLSL